MDTRFFVAVAGPDEKRSALVGKADDTVSTFTLQFQIFYVLAMTVVFFVIAHFTRARARRTVGALAAVIVFILLSKPIDLTAARYGWWRYPAVVNPPLLFYVGQALEFVGTTALVGWRINRRFGWRGAATVSALVCGLGLPRDLTVARFTQVIRFGPGPIPWIADVGAWMIVVGTALGITRVVGGAKSDVLSRAA